MLKAFRGQLLHVNLSNHNISVESLDETIAKNFLGGAGYACRYLYDRLNNEDVIYYKNNRIKKKDNTNFVEEFYFLKLILLIIEKFYKHSLPSLNCTR